VAGGEMVPIMGAAASTGIHRDADAPLIDPRLPVELGLDVLSDLFISAHEASYSKTEKSV
jgi:hypothetical protein